MRLYFIRHAQSTNNLLYEETGSSEGRSEDPRISSTGLEQLKALTSFWRHPTDPSPYAPIRLTHLYTSLMQRAVMTACAVGEGCGLSPVGEMDLFEEGGVYLDDETGTEQMGQPGKPRSFFQHHFPQLALPPEVGEEGWYNRPYEEVPLRAPRAQRLLKGLREKHGDTDDCVALVSHGGFYNVFMTLLMGYDLRQPLRFSLNNAAMTRLDFLPGKIVMMYANRVDYLPGSLIT